MIRYWPTRCCAAGRPKLSWTWAGDKPPPGVPGLVTAMTNVASDWPGWYQADEDSQRSALGSGTPDADAEMVMGATVTWPPAVTVVTAACQ
jgi:hypothetical protein